MVGYMLLHTNGITDLIHLTKFEPFEFNFEILAFVLLGALSGLLGASFVYVTSKLIYLRAHLAYPQIHTRYRYTLLVALVCAVVTYSAAFLQLSDKSIINQMFRAEKLSNYEQLYWNNPSTVFNLVLYVVVKLLLTALSISCQIPCGFVAPVFTGGAAFGRLFGYIVDLILGTEHKGVYAVVGAACLVSSVTHTLSISIIVFELTGQMNYILPMMVGVLVAYAVSTTVSMSLYSVILKIKGLPYLPFIKPSWLYSKTVLDVCSDKLFVRQNTSLRQVVAVICEATGIIKVPVVDDEHFLIGEVPVSRLKQILIRHYSMSTGRLSHDEKSFLNEHLNPVLNPEKSVLNAWDERGEAPAVQKFFSETVEIDEESIDRAPLSIPEELSLIKVQFMFVMMGLVQIYVVKRGKFVGVVTRESLTAK
jgi:CBS domain-containing protein